MRIKLIVVCIPSSHKKGVNVHQKTGHENGQSFFFFAEYTFSILRTQTSEYCVKYLAREPFSDALLLLEKNLLRSGKSIKIIDP